jgi:hypothetical protein
MEEKKSMEEVKHDKFKEKEKLDLAEMRSRAARSAEETAKYRLKFREHEKKAKDLIAKAAKLEGRADILGEKSEVAQAQKSEIVGASEKVCLDDLKEQCAKLEAKAAKMETKSAKLEYKAGKKDRQATELREKAQEYVEKAAETLEKIKYHENEEQEFRARIEEMEKKTG